MTGSNRYSAGAAKTIVRRALNTSVPDTLPADMHPVLRRAYRARQVYSADDLDRSADGLLAPTQLHGIDVATMLLAEVLTRRERILVVADFDADGATSCALVVRALREMGAHDVEYLVPNRFEFGYGLTPEIVALPGRRGRDQLCSSGAGVARDGRARCRVSGAESFRVRLRVDAGDRRARGAARAEID